MRTILANDGTATARAFHFARARSSMCARATPSPASNSSNGIRSHTSKPHPHRTDKSASLPPTARPVVLRSTVGTEPHSGHLAGSPRSLNSSAAAELPIMASSDSSASPTHDAGRRNGHSSSAIAVDAVVVVADVQRALSGHAFVAGWLYEVGETSHRFWCIRGFSSRFQAEGAFDWVEINVTLHRFVVTRRLSQPPRHFPALVICLHSESLTGICCRQPDRYACIAPIATRDAQNHHSSKSCFPPCSPHFICVSISRIESRSRIIESRVAS